MLVMEHDIQVGNYRVGLIDSVKIKKSVETLSDTADIVLPGVYVNRSLNIETKLKVGDEVIIKLGYLRELKTEFKGYLKAFKIDGSSVTLECEDAMYLFRKTSVRSREYKQVSLKQLLGDIVQQVGVFRVDCDFDFTYEKYVTHNATALDVLKKIQNETKANVYVEGTTLHVHPKYSTSSGNRVVYDFSVNVETSNLKYRSKDQRDYQVEVESICPNGERVKVTVGSGSEKRSIKIYGITDKQSLKARAEEQLKLIVYDGYDGDFTGWLIPYCQPTDTVSIIDTEAPERNGMYYVVGCDVEFSSSGGKRKITIGHKIG